MSEKETLRAVAEERGFDVGAAVDAEKLRTDWSYAETVRTEFTYLTTENAMKWGPIRPSEHTYDFENADDIVDFGRKHDMPVRGHVLAWHNQPPEWFHEWDYTDEELRRFLRTHVQTIAGRYRGDVHTWDVVNEAVLDDATMRESVWYDAMGEEYIDLAFEWTNQVAPDAKLFYNDYHANEVNEKSDRIYELVSGMLDRGVPIDGVGLQMHALREKPDPESIVENARRFQDLGLEVQITELDVSYPLEGGPEDHLEAQADYYRSVVEACLEAGIDTLVTWGVRDEDSWVHDWATDIHEDPLLFDGSDPKPAYHAVKETLADDDR